MRSIFSFQCLLLLRKSRQSRRSSFEVGSATTRGHRKSSVKSFGSLCILALFNELRSSSLSLDEERHPYCFTKFLAPTHPEKPDNFWRPISPSFSSSHLWSTLSLSIYLQSDVTGRATV